MEAKKKKQPPNKIQQNQNKKKHPEIYFSI